MTSITEGGVGAGEVECGAAKAVGRLTPQSLRVQVGARYRDQDRDRASPRGSAYRPRG